MATTHKSGSFRSSIVHGGRTRWAAGINEELRLQIQQAVEEEYAARLAEAGWLARKSLRREMKAEVERRVRAKVKEQRPSNQALF